MRVNEALMRSAVWAIPVSFLSFHVQTRSHENGDLPEDSAEEFYFLFIVLLGVCHKCGQTITDVDDPCDILGQTYHSSCAVCVLCGRSVKNKHFFLQDHLYCEEDFLVKYLYFISLQD